MRWAKLIEPPALFAGHAEGRPFVGPGTLRLPSGEVLMAAPAPQSAPDSSDGSCDVALPWLYHSGDAGRSWQAQGPFQMRWSLSGEPRAGGMSLLRLHDGRLAALFHRQVAGQHGGGLPAITFSNDDGITWSDATTVGTEEGVWYVMNDRLIQLGCGRLIVPVAHMPAGLGSYEGDRNVGLCLYSDDGGTRWQQSRAPARLDDARGMAEPCVTEIENGRLLMLARTGSGCLYRSISCDGGDSWSQPQPTGLLSPCAPFTMRCLPDGRLIVVYNHAEPLERGGFFPRTPLAYALSSDGGLSWGEPCVIDHHPSREFIYPSICMVPEGVLIVYSEHYTENRFGSGSPEERLIGGGKRCILAYPDY